MAGRRRAIAWLLRGHAVVTAAAGVVLVVAPGAIPGAVGVTLPSDAYLVAYLLAAAEFAFAALSWWGSTIAETAAVRGVVLACVVLHAASALLEIVAVARGTDRALWYNVAARVLIVALFVRFLPPSAATPSSAG